MNDFPFNKKKVNKFRGDNIAKYEYRPYTHEELSSLLSICDERGKVIILLMASSGMRVGALPTISLKHLKRWKIANSDSFVYQIKVYPNSPKYRHNTFCSPECAASIDRYLSLRKRCGENLKQDELGNWLPGDTRLIIQNFSKENYPILPKAVKEESLSNYIVNKLEEIGLRTRKKIIATSYTSRVRSSKTQKRAPSLP